MNRDKFKQMKVLKMNKIMQKTLNNRKKTIINWEKIKQMKVLKTNKMLNYKRKIPNNLKMIFLKI